MGLGNCVIHLEYRPLKDGDQALTLKSQFLIQCLAHGKYSVNEKW